MKKFNTDALLREPLLHFLLIGAALFFLYGVQNAGFDNVDNRILISKAKIEHLQAVWNKKWQRPPTAVELKGMIEQQIREEVLYREALVMGLEQNDSIIRRRLAQKVEFISADLAAQVEPTDAELTDYLAAHAEKFEQPARISFVQIYFSAERRKGQAEKNARDFLAELNRADSKIDINEAGDSFMLGLQHEQVSEYEVSRLFGQDFAGKIFRLPVGSWQGPVSSGYGFHLIRLNSKTVAQPAQLDTVRDRVRNEWLGQQRRNMDEAFYQSLRKRYRIIVEDGLSRQIRTSEK